MAKAQEADENHWPGFVDALSTIVMVVTFLLIILATAIFVLSINIAKKTNVEKEATTSTNVLEERLVNVEQRDDQLKNTEDASLMMRSEKVLKLQFFGTTLSIDQASKDQVASYFVSNIADNQARLAITSFFDGAGTQYTQQQRLAYYRAMAVRNEVIAQGLPAEQVTVSVREASGETAPDTVYVTRLE